MGQKVKRVRPRWAYVSCRRAELSSHTQRGMFGLTDGPSVTGAECLASPAVLRKVQVVFLIDRSVGRGVELGPRRDWREGDGFVVGRLPPLGHLP